MILFDTSVIIDARDQASPFHAWAKQQISAAVGGDGAAVNTVVLAEASVRAVNKDVPALLMGFGMTLVDLPVSAAVPAAKAFAFYLDRRKAEGHELQSRMPFPDFFIGAHAEAENLRLATRDPDRIRTYFPRVALITPPSKHPTGQSTS